MHHHPRDTVEGGGGRGGGRGGEDEKKGRGRKDYINMKVFSCSSKLRFSSRVLIPQFFKKEILLLLFAFTFAFTFIHSFK
jgi:hypothetical protein